MMSSPTHPDVSAMTDHHPMGWFLYVWGQEIPALETLQVQRSESNSPLRFVRGRDFVLAFEHHEASPQPAVTWADTGDTGLLLAGEVRDWRRLEAIAPGELRFRAGTESRAGWLARLYRVHGDLSWLDTLHGEFRVIAHDRIRDVVCIAGSPLGGVPVFWHRAHERLAFSSHWTSLLTLPGVSTRLNERQVFRYLYLNAVQHDDDTLLEAVRAVPADTEVRFDPQKEQRVRRWTPRTIEIHGSELELVEEFRRRLRRALTATTGDAAQPAVSMSGGVGSTTLTALLAGLNPGAVSTHSVLYSEFPAEADRVRAFLDAVTVRARLLRPTPAQFLEDFEPFVRASDMPFTHPGMYTMFLTFRSAARDHADVLLVGHGDDAQFGSGLKLIPSVLRALAREEGYRTTLREAAVLARRVRLRSIFGPMALERLPRPVARRLWERTIGAAVAHEWARPNLGLAAWHPQEFAASRAALAPTYGPMSSLYRQMGERMGVRVRFPYLEPGVTEFAGGVPMRLLLRHGLMKYVLRAAGAGIVPDVVRLNPARLGYTFPFSGWVRGPLRSFFEAALRDAGGREYIDPQALKRRFASYLTAPRWQHEAFLWRVVNLEAWQRVVVERGPVPERWFHA